MGDREDEFDELLSYIEEKFADNEVERRSDAMDSAWVRAEALQRLVLADLRAVEELEEIPAFEDGVDDDGKPVKRPNQALKRVLQEISDMIRELPLWEQGQASYGLMRERQELAEAWKNFGWKQQKLVPGSDCERMKIRLQELEMLPAHCGRKTGDRVVLRKKVKPTKLRRLTKKERALLHKEDQAPDPRDIETYRTRNAGAWVIYDAHEREHFELNKVTRDNWDCLHSPGKRAQIESEEYNSQLDVQERENLDMVLPEYPVSHHDPKAASEGYLALETLKEVWDFPNYNGAEDRGFCHWIKARGGRAKLDDLVDDVKYYINHRPRFGAEPIVMLKRIKYASLTAEGVDEEASYLTEVDRDWYFTNWDGEPSSKFNTDHVFRKAEALIGQWLCETDTLPHRLNSGVAGSLEPCGWDKHVPNFKTFVGKTHKVMRRACCSTCSSRIGERGSWFWDMLNSLPEMYATQFRETGDLGAYTLFIRDEVDARETQRKLLGDTLFESDDTWHIRGKSGNWCCLLCGRSKVFRSYYVKIKWVSGPRMVKPRSVPKGIQRLSLSRGRQWSALIRIGGEKVLDRVATVVNK